MQAYLLYQQNQFEDANRIFNQGRLDDLLPIDLNYAGMSALSVNPPNTTIAKRYFEELSSRTGHDFTNSAKWHLALINVLEGNTDNAKPFLEELSSGGTNKYSSSAKELLESMD
ncbi:MAG: hypothetical protein HKN67_05535 [Saprospiraceae bacterium]|nr:hypothetical protein [Saprospiraceae bacterium]